MKGLKRRAWPEREGLAFRILVKEQFWVTMSFKLWPEGSESNLLT